MSTDETEEDDLPEYETLVKYIREAPDTWRGALLAEAIASAMDAPVFVDDAALIRSVESMVRHHRRVMEKGASNGG